MANYRDRPLSANGERVLADRVAQENGQPVERDRNTGAPMRQMKGFYEEPYDPIDYFKLSQNMRPEEAKREAQRLKRENTIIGPGGKQMSDDNPSARAKTFRDQVNGVATPAGTPAAMRGRINGAGQDPAPNTLSGEGYDVPLSGTGGYTDPPDQQDPFKNVKPPPAPAAVPAAVQPVDPSTVRQPVGMIDPENTPAMRRQMAADAAMGRTVNTTGTTGLIPSATGGRPMQAADYRRSIASKYGTGTNVARTADQGSTTTTDLMGRPAQLRQYLRDREEIQRTKGMA